jgi:hypothetical protein
VWPCGWGSVIGRAAEQVAVSDACGNRRQGGPGFEYSSLRLCHADYSEGAPHRPPITGRCRPRVHETQTAIWSAIRLLPTSRLMAANVAMAAGRQSGEAVGRWAVVAGSARRRRGSSRHGCAPLRVTTGEQAVGSDSLPYGASEDLAGLGRVRAESTKDQLLGSVSVGSGKRHDPVKDVPVEFMKTLFGDGDCTRRRHKPVPFPFPTVRLAVHREWYEFLPARRNRSARPCHVKCGGDQDR